MSALRLRADYAREEEERLASFALCAAASRGRVHAEPEHDYRSAFQRDRDRIVHSRAFRRLEYKTQVFVPHEGDHYRNRLTHTIEGSQIARSIARILRANEDLAEAIVLAHDLGHTPYGHAGERVLDGLMRDAGGFDHNRQTLRIVDWLEDRYPDFRGLNLCHETREGILKHGGGFTHPVPLPEVGTHPPLEAQIADVSDEIAYLSHDLDDGLRSQILSPGALAGLALWSESRGEVESRCPDAGSGVLNAQTIRGVLDRLVTDLVEAAAGRLERHRVRDVNGVREAPERLVAFSEGVETGRLGLKEFLSVNLYHHPDVLEMTRRAETILKTLFEAYSEDASRLPDHVRDRVDEEGPGRAIADYIAGMTDRFAEAEASSFGARVG